MARPGVVGLQGSSEAHLARLRDLGHDPVEVRQARHLDGLTHLILPGGESTTLHHLLDLYRLWDPIMESYRDGELALFGTCAGAILLGSDNGERPPRMGLVDLPIERNAYGRQIDSFSRDVALEGPLEGPLFHAVFIRAPRIRRVGPPLRVLARDHVDPILVEGDRILIATFHPELTDDRRIHRYFLAK